MSQLYTAPRSRRNTELVLLVLALAIAIGADMLVTINLSQPFGAAWFTRVVVFSALPLVMHVVLRLRAKYADPVILPVVTALNGLGLAMIQRLDIANGDDAATRQLVWMAIAVAAAVVVLVVLRDHRVLRRYTYISFVVSVVLLVLPLVPGLGQEINGSRVWIRIGFGSFQPGEIAKITLAVFFAGYLSTNRDLILLAGKKIGPVQLPRARDLAPMVVAWLLGLGILVVQSDIGMSVMFFTLFMVMIYVATSRSSWILIGLVLVAAGAVFAYTFIGHVQARVDGWRNAFDPEVFNAAGGSWQIVQGLFGLANGGLFGTGLGLGRPDLVTYANSDMIVAALGEEIGLIGVVAIVLLYVILVSRGMRAALGTRDAFGKLLACGLAFAVAVQCFVIMGGVTRLIPLTGLTTPFMSAGGSSLLANWIIVALLLLISNAARRPAPSGPIREGDLPSSGIDVVEPRTAATSAIGTEGATAAGAGTPARPTARAGRARQGGSTS
ncbi:FtsW/RodA/SpoVE family cell cycle protein [Tersicoccus sp. MR15.9]|uniref:FtsW/RodA/SpoVE family cell cycle protein n=1 Tax=Tersicoccus mangrovi TaxID=3121635 RepID=UPI002FE55D7B